MQFKPPEPIGFELLENDTDSKNPPISELLPLYTVSSNIYENKKMLSDRLNADKNTDIVIREFNTVINNAEHKCFIMFTDGMVSNEIINRYIIMRMQNNPYAEKRFESNEMTAVMDYVCQNLISNNSLTRTTDISIAAEGVVAGLCTLFIDGCNETAMMDVRTVEHRTVDRPNQESSIVGPQESFVELIRTNTALIRRYLSDTSLVCESISQSKRTKTTINLMYIKDIANPALIKEIKRRFGKFKTDFMMSSETIGRMLQDSPNVPITQFVMTERPDKVAYGLMGGRVAILVNGSPLVIVLPGTFHDMTVASDDLYMDKFYTFIIRIIRNIAIVITFLLPSIFLSVFLYHRDMLPIGFLLNFNTFSENIVFPLYLQIILLEILFEIIREAALRMPNHINSVMGIVGALILGQSLTEANIVNPFVLILVALTAISSFAMPSFVQSTQLRSQRFVFLTLAYLCGFFGLAIGLFIYLSVLFSLKSFGVPFFAPFSPLTRRKKHSILNMNDFTGNVAEDYINPSVTATLNATEGR